MRPAPRPPAALRIELVRFGAALLCLLSWIAVVGLLSPLPELLALWMRR